MSTERNTNPQNSSVDTDTEAPMSTTETETNGLDSYFTADSYTPYGVRTVVNAVLRDLGVERVLPGPMFYTYAKKGYLRSYTTTEGKVRVAKDAAIEWTEGYLQKLVAKASRTEADVPEADVQEDEVEMTEPMDLDSLV